MVDLAAFDEATGADSSGDDTWAVPGPCEVLARVPLRNIPPSLAKFCTKFSELDRGSPSPYRGTILPAKAIYTITETTAAMG